MSEPSDDKTRKNSERKLSPTEIIILYWLATNRKFRGSKSELRRQLGYPSDGSVHPHLIKLISEGYVEEKPTKKGTEFFVTRKGRDAIFFLRQSDLLLAVVAIVGVLDIYVSLDNLIFHVPYTIYTTLVSGASLIGIYVVVRATKRRIAHQFLGIRPPLGESESVPRDGQDDVSDS